MSQSGGLTNRFPYCFSAEWLDMNPDLSAVIATFDL
jgi:hypothetical protein